MKNKKSAFAQLVLMGALLLGIILLCFPFYMMIVISLDKGSNIAIPFPPKIWPKDLSFFNYKFILGGDFKFTKYFLNTLYICVGSVLASVSSALLAGYAFSKLNFPFKRIFFVITLSTMMIPAYVLMVPTFMVVRKIGIHDTYWAYYLTSLMYAFGTFFVKQFMDGLPNSLGESARIDGANRLKIFTRIFLPLCGPIIATLVILQFMGYYNDIYGVLIYLRTKSKYNLAYAIAMYNSKNRNAFGITFALASLSTVPIMTVFLIFQRYIVQSIAVSGIKQ